MPVSVHIPTRLHVDPAALFTRRSCVESSLRAAVSRAAQNSRRSVLDRRGGYVEVQVHPPEFSWCGDGLVEIPGVLRSLVESSICDVFSTVLEEAGIGIESATSDIPLSEAPVAPVDQDRLEQGLDLYTLPSFKGGGEPKRVPVARPGEKKFTEPNELNFIRMASSQMALNTLNYLAIHRIIHVPQEGFLGTVYEDTQGGLVVMVLRLSGGKVFPLFSGALKGLKAPEFDPATKKPKLSTVHLEKSGHFQLKYFGSANTEEEHRLLLRAFYSADFRQMIVAADRKSKKNAHEPLSEEQIERRVEEWISGLLAVRAKETKAYLLLTVNQRRVLIQIDFEVPQELDISLVNMLPHMRAGAHGGEKAGAKGERHAGGTGEGGKAGAQNGTPGASSDHKGAEHGTTVQAGPPDEKGPCFEFDVFASGDEAYCSSFRGEPSLDDLGESGRHVSEFVGEIAARLRIAPCQYPGRFCVRAFEIINSEASRIGEALATEETAGVLTASPNGQGNLRTAQFQPKFTPAIQRLRALAGITSVLTRLSQAIANLYEQIDRGNRKGCDSRVNSWILHFYIDKNEQLRYAIANLFVQTCRAVFLQVLYASRRSIYDRLFHIGNISEIFRETVLPQLHTLSDLLSLRERLKQARIDVARSGPYWYYTTWQQAHEAASGSGAGTQPGPNDDIVWNDFRIDGIRGKDGRVWTDEALEKAIVLRRGVAEEIDPVVKHMADLQGVVEKLRKHPEQTEQELRKILIDMLASNQEFIDKTKNSEMYAFRTGHIVETSRSQDITVADTSYALRGIHRLAHDQIHDAFNRDWSYGAGIEFLFGSEQGLHSFAFVAEFAGIVLLSVVCPPLGFAAGVGSALYHYEEAKEKERLFDAFMDPEEFISRAEVETELFAARLGLVLTFLPEAGSIVRSGIRGVKMAVEEGAVTAVRATARAAARKALEEMAERLAQGVIQAFIKELFVADSINRFLSILLDPLMQAVEREVSITQSVGGLRGAASVIEQIYPSGSADSKTGDAGRLHE